MAVIWQTDRASMVIVLDVFVRDYQGDIVLERGCVVAFVHHYGLDGKVPLEWGECADIVRPRVKHPL